MILFPANGEELIIIPDFFLSMIPPTTTSQEKGLAVGKNGKPYAYTKYKNRAVENEFYRLLLPHKPKTPLTGPVMLTVLWSFPKGKSHKDGEWKITKPDTDNLQKILKDIMTKAGFWVDDSRVCCETVLKQWSDIPGIYISYGEMT